MPAGPPYEFLDHTGDIRFIARGATMAALFENAARALYAAIAEPDGVRPSVERAIEASAEDREMLLVAWLAACQEAFDLDRVLLCEFRVDAISDTRVRGVTRGEAYDPARHEFRTEIKAVTFHGLAVREVPGGWEADVVCDV